MILDKDFSKEEITTLIESIKREIDLEYLTDDYHGKVFDYIDTDDNDLFNAIEAWRINPNVLDLSRDKIERSSRISSSSSRLSRGSNDSIFDSLPHEFNVVNATIAKGGNASSNSVRMMLRNWTQQGLISRKGDDLYVKTA